MALYKEKLEEIMTYYERIMNMYIHELEGAPEVRLVCQKNHNGKQFLLSVNVNGKRKRTSITNNMPVLRALARKEFARKALEILEPDVKALKEAVEKQKPFDPDLILESMTKAYRHLPEEYFFDREKVVTSLGLDGADEVRISRHKEWGEKPYDQSRYYEEHKNERTSRGEYVRSKSELLIIETLYHYEIPVHYEVIPRL